MNTSFTATLRSPSDPVASNAFRHVLDLVCRSPGPTTAITSNRQPPRGTPRRASQSAAAARPRRRRLSAETACAAIAAPAHCSGGLSPRRIPRVSPSRASRDRSRLPRASRCAPARRIAPRTPSDNEPPRSSAHRFREPARILTRTDPGRQGLTRRGEAEPMMDTRPELRKRLRRCSGVPYPMLPLEPVARIATRRAVP